MFVSISEIDVDEASSEDLERAFAVRSRLVDAHPGFLGLELFRDVVHAGRFVLLTRWSDRASFRAYLRSADFKLAHQRERDAAIEATGGAPLRQLERVEIDGAR